MHCKEREGALCALDFSFIACTLRRVIVDKHCMHCKPKKGSVCGCMLALLTDERRHRVK
jgi:hypothetical protein